MGFQRVKRSTAGKASQSKNCRSVPPRRKGEGQTLEEKLERRGESQDEYSNRELQLTNAKSRTRKIGTGENNTLKQRVKRGVKQPFRLTSQRRGRRVTGGGES